MFQTTNANNALAAHLNPTLDATPQADENETPGIPSDESPWSAYALEILENQPFRGYELSAILSGGDRRAVFKSHDTTLDRPVAIKVMRPWQGREGVVEDFFSLAGSIARLKCPGVARGFDAGRGDGDFFLVYEFLSGESLEHMLQKRQSGKLTEKKALKLIVELLGILQNLFDRGNPHGNLKPSNILVADGDLPRLADIGFAWNLAWATDDEAFMAYPEYLPPERLAGELNVDIRGDLYSLGAIWFRMLSGQPVFEGETPEETVRLHMEQKAPLLSSIDPKISNETSTVIAWLLEKNRDARPRTPRAVLKKLAQHPLILENTGVAGMADSDDVCDESDEREIEENNDTTDNAELIVVTSANDAGHEVVDAVTTAAPDSSQNEYPFGTEDKQSQETM